MKMAIVFLFALSTKIMASDVSTISCMIKEAIPGEKVKNVKVEFLVSKLGTSKATLLQHPKMNEDLGPILVVPNEKNNIAILNEQGGDLRVDDEKIRLFGDGDGYTFVDLVLFKDSDFQKGYVRVYGSGDQYFQKINCTVK